MMEPKKTGLELLRSPFPKHQISLLPKPFKKDSQKGNCDVCGGYHGLPAAHLEYVGHAALTDRLLEVDINWTWEPMSITPEGLPAFDKSGGLWIKLTVCGQTRLGYGNAETSTYKEIGSREKECIGDALRNAAMRFGAALDLWHKGELHLNEETPKKQPVLQKLKEPEIKTAAPFKFKEPKVTYMTDPRIKMLYAMSKEAKWNEKNLRDFVKNQFGLESNRLLSKEQFELIIAHLKAKPSPVAEVLFDQNNP